MTNAQITSAASAAGGAAATGVQAGVTAASKLKLQAYGSSATRLEPGNHLMTVKLPALVGRAVAALNRTWTAATGAFEAVASKNGQTVRFPKTNFVDPKTGLDKVGGTYQARKWYDEKKGVLYVHFAVIR